MNIFCCFWLMFLAVAGIWDRVRGKMRFWGKTKYGEKKTSREKLICGGDSLDGDYGDTGPLLGEGALEQNPPPHPKKKNGCFSTVKKVVTSPPSSHRRSRAGEPLTALQPRSDAGSRLPRHEGEQGAVPQGEAEAQCEDQQRRPGASPVAERRAADPHLHQRLQEHERLPDEEGERSLQDFKLAENTLELRKLSRRSFSYLFVRSF